MGLAATLQRTYYGLATALQRRINEGTTAIESHRSLLHLEKQNFHTTLQLVTRSSVIICEPDSCSGDSFHFTRHPLITLT